MRATRLLVALVAAGVILATPGVARADAPFAVRALQPYKLVPERQRVEVKLELRNLSNQKVIVSYKRLPNGARSRDITLWPQGSAAEHTRHSIVELPCASTAILAFRYGAVGGGSESELTFTVTTPVCPRVAGNSTEPRSSPPDPDKGDQDGFWDNLKQSALVVAGLLAGLIALRIWWRSRKRR